MHELEYSTQELFVVATFVNVEDAWDFTARFERNFSFASICSQTFRAYSKFDYGYWFDWVLIVEDINTARNKIRNCFGTGWIELGDAEIWNAENKYELSVPIWAKLSTSNSIELDEARQLDPQPQMDRGESFISVSTTGKITGVYPNRNYPRT